MKTDFYRTITTLTFLIIFLFCAFFSTVYGSDDNIDWENAPPSLMHQKLWEGKLSAKMNKDFARKIAAQEALINTQTNYDVQFYDINIRVNDTIEIIYGVVKFVALAAENGISEIQVDFYSNMTIDSIVALSGALSYSRLGNVVTVVLDQTYNIDEQFEFDFYYQGHPQEGGFQAFAFNYVSGTPMISTLSEPYFARTWWPCKDRMDDKADSFNIAVTVDTSLYVASNGTLDSTIEHGDNTHTVYYSVRYPMVSYLFSLAIYDYTIWYDEWVYNNNQDTMLLVHAVYPNWYEYSLGTYNITPYALTVFSDNYGLYPFANEKYGHANFEWGGAMEHQTMSSMVGSTFGFWEPVIVHEMSHQWWGDMITCESWGHIWLNEGWASYSEALYYQVKDGWDAYRSYMNGMAYGGGGTIYVYDTTSVWNIFNGGLSYDKGAWVCHMLRGVLKDSLFFAGIDAYYNSQYQHGAATTEKFRDVFEAATGVELDWFFEDWIYGTYRPSYRYSYWEELSDTSGYDVFLYVEQLQTTNPQVFRMPVDFAFDFVNGTSDTVTLKADQREKLFKLNFPAQLANIELDPLDWVLKYRTLSSWQFKIVTFNEEISEGYQYVEYLDTIETRGASSTTSAIVAGALPTGLNIDNDGIISGVPSDSGLFTFTVRMTETSFNTYDEKEFSIYINPSAYVPGDIDMSGEIDIADLVFLVEYMFHDGPPPLMINQADLDGSCEVNIADLVYFVDYQFFMGPAPVFGCVE